MGIIKMANAKTYVTCKYRCNVKQQRTDFVLDRHSTKEELALFIHPIRSYVAGADAAMSFRWGNDHTIRGSVLCSSLVVIFSALPLMRLESRSAFIALLVIR